MRNLLIATLAVLSCMNAFAQTDESMSADPVVIRVGDVDVRQSEFEAMLESLPPEYQVYVREPAGRRAFARDFVEMKVLSIEAVKRGVADDPAVATQLRIVRDNTLASAMISRLEQNMAPDPSAIEKRYEERKADYEEVSARHILIAFEGSPAARPERSRTEEEAKALAEKLRSEIEGGADFAEVAREQSDDTFSGQNGGDLGSFGRGQMVGEFEDAVFGGEIGKIGDVVRTQYGYHIIEVTDRSSKTLDAVSEEIRTELVREMLQSRLEEMTSSFEVTYDDEYFGPAAAEGSAEPPSGEGR